MYNYIINKINKIDKINKIENFLNYRRITKKIIKIKYIFKFKQINFSNYKYNLELNK